MTTHFIAHAPEDTVGVIVVEDVQAGQQLTGWVMDTDATIHVTALEAIPLGHKIALKDHAESATVIKYGHDIGRTVAPVKQGAHLHVHNAKTKRW